MFTDLLFCVAQNSGDFVKHPVNNSHRHLVIAGTVPDLNVLICSSRWECFVNHYRIYLLNAAGRIVSGQDAMCVDDEAARLVAGDLVEIGRDAEVWSGRRRVGRVTVNGLGRPAYAGIAAMVANDLGAIRGGLRNMAAAVRSD